MNEPQRLPIFPLKSVLFPHGILHLRIFEARYLDMIAQCMKTESSFGVCLIAEGNEVGTPAAPHEVGTEARIVDWDMTQPNLLGLKVRGGRRFRLLEQVADPQGLITGIVQWFDEPAAEPVNEIHRVILPLLQAVVLDAGETRIPKPYALEDAAWVGYRYAEILPIQPLARQRLLELEDADMRLAIIHEYLQKQGLLSPAQER